jgi:copper homeostasis protein
VFFVWRRQEQLSVRRNNVLSHQFVFELCADSLEGCVAANRGGAHRIELCTALDVGGLTPPLAIIESAVQSSRIPVHVLLRPTAETFCYSQAMLDLLAQSVADAKALKVAGVVFGVLRSDGTVDVDQTRRLVELAHPLPVTFHRAFDETPDLSQALEDVIACGCERVLTSGGAPDVLSGAQVLARLVAQAEERIDIAMGGGLRLANARRVAQLTHGRHFHGSLQAEAGKNPTADRLSEAIQALIEQLTLTTGVDQIGPSVCSKF